MWLVLSYFNAKIFILANVFFDHFCYPAIDFIDFSISKFEKIEIQKSNNITLPNHHQVIYALIKDASASQ